MRYMYNIQDAQQHNDTMHAISAMHRVTGWGSGKKSWADGGAATGEPKVGDPLLRCFDQDGSDCREGRRLLRSWTRAQLHKANQEECRVGFHIQRFNLFNIIPVKFRFRLDYFPRCLYRCWLRDGSQKNACQQLWNSLPPGKMPNYDNMWLYQRIHNKIIYLCVC